MEKQSFLTRVFGSRAKDSESKRSESKRAHPRAAHHKRFAVARNKRLGPKVFGQGLSADESLRRDVIGVRVASRAAGEDDSYARRYLSMVQTHVVGDKGFAFQSLVKGRDGKLDKNANNIIEQAWREFCELGVGEISGRLSMVEADELIVKTVAQDGDLLIRHVWGRENKFGYSIQLIEADLLDVTLNKNLDDGRRIRMGVELDLVGRHLAYHILTAHPGDNTWSYNGRKYVRVPANEMILPFPMWRPGQNRGIPWAHAALLEMHHAHGFREAELTGARVAASNMLFYERDPEQMPPDDDDDEDGWSDSGEFLHELEPASSSIVPEGYRVKETGFKPSNSEFPNQLKTALRGTASGTDVNYNVLANDYEGVNFSSLRQAVLEDRDHWKRKQRWFINSVKNIVFREFLKSALLNKALPGLSSADFNELNRPHFRGRRWQWVDPLKDEKAAGEALSNFTANPIDVLNEKGVDLDEMADGWATFMDKMGVIISQAQALGYGRNIAPHNPRDELDEQDQ